MNWYYVDGPQRVGPVTESDWAELVRSGKIQPATLVWHEGMANWTPYSEAQPPPLPETEPEEESEIESEDEHDEPRKNEESAEEAPEAFAARVLERDYPVNTGYCIAQGWQLLKSHFWMLVGSTFLILAITLVGLKIPAVGWMLSMALQGVLMGGLFNVYLRLMRGQSAVTTDLFAGFDPKVFQQLALKTLVTSIIMELLFIPGMIAASMTGITAENLALKLESEPQAVMTCLLVILAGLIPAIYFSFCWMFALPLIIDKRMRFWPAMQLSRRKVLQHPWKISILVTAAGIVGSAGALLVGIGIIFTLPIYIAATLYLYEDIFGKPAEPSPEAAPDTASK